MVMANPVQRILWGSEMSQERAQNRGKDGGAHDSPHEASFDDGVLYLSKESLSSDAREMADVNSLHLEQDGGTISLLSADGEDMVDMYPYDQGVGENAEWVKTKCKSLSIDFDGVGEENVGDMLGLGTESKVDNLMTIGGQFLGSGISEDSGIILCSDGASASSISSGNDAKCSDIIPLCSLSDDLNSRTDQVLCPSSLRSTENGSSILLDSNSVGVPSSVFNDLSTSASLDNSSFTTFSSKTNQKADTVEELSTSNQISLLETSFPSLASSSQSLLTGTCAIASSVSDSSCGILPNFLGIDSLTTSPGNELGLLNEVSSASIVDNESLQHNVLLSVPDSADLTNATITGSDESAKVDLTDPSNITLAMISVSTDKDANSTQIVVNTSQGQQLYMINTASLNQASNSGVQVAQPAESVSAVQGIPAIQTSGAQNQFILLPVVASALVEGGADEGEGQEEKLMCPERGCGKTFTKMSKMKIHTMQHTGERPFRCSKESCDWAFTTAYKLKRHEESHEGKKDFFCDYEGCNRKFTTIYNLNSHRRLHDRPCTEKCPEEGCHERFPTKRHLELHMKTHISEERAYRCSFPGCEMVFQSALNMGSHARIHKEPEADLRCNFEGCGKVFVRQCRLKQHMRQHTGEKPYKCNFEGCNWAFTTASKLKRHSAKHLNLRKYKCDQCDKSFMRPEHLKGHRITHTITHTGVKPFTCPQEGCEASFTAKSSLYVHMNKHKDQGSGCVFLCPMDGCSLKYPTKSQLRTHILHHCMNEEEVEGQEMAQLLRTSSYVSYHDGAGKGGGLSQTVGGVENHPGGQFGEGGVEISPDQLTNAAVTQLLSMPITISVPQSPHSTTPSPNTTPTPNTPTTPTRNTTPTTTREPTISLETSMRRPVLKNRSGCARTDFHSNHHISRQARQRLKEHQLQQQPEEMEAQVPMETDISLTACADPLVKQEGEMYTTSVTDAALAALSFRDPDTGLTYVHTQLLQDDPPQPVYYSADSLGLSGEAGDLNHGMLDMVTSHFTNTTINLNDLV